MQLIKSGKRKKGGVAYEWKGEDVYHAYIEYPKVSPSGFSVVCLFEIIDNQTVTLLKRYREKGIFPLLPVP